MEKHSQMRKKILTHRSIQFRFAAFVTLYAAATAFVTSTIVFFTTFSLLGEKLADVYPAGRLQSVYQTVYLIFAGILIAAIPLIFYLSIKFSHRIVGPLPKIDAFLRRVGEGDFEQMLMLRKNDELNDLANTINEMTQNLKSRFTPH